MLHAMSVERRVLDVCYVPSWPPRRCSR